MTTLAHPFTRGLDLRTSAKLVEPPYLLAADHVHFDPDGALRKRPGHELLPKTTFDGKAIADAVGLETYNDQLLLISSDGLRVYTDAVGWVRRGEMSFTSLSLRGLRPTSRTPKTLTCASKGDLELYVYTDDRPAAHYTLADRRYGAYLAEDVALPEQWLQPRLVQIDDTWLLITSTTDVLGSTLGVSSVSFAPTDAIGQRSIVISDIGEARVWNVAEGPGVVYVGYATLSGVKVTGIDAAKAVGPDAGIMPITRIGIVPSLIALTSLPNSRVALVALPNGEPGAGQLDSLFALEANVATGTFVLRTDGPTLAVEPGRDIVALGAYTRGEEAYVVGNAQSPDYPSYFDVPINLPEVRETANEVLLGSPWVESHGDVFSFVGSRSTPTVFVANLTQRAIVGAYDAGLGDYQASDPLLPVRAIDGKVELPLRRPVTLALSAYRMHQVRFLNQAPPAARVGGSLVWSGGLAYSYDGGSLVEHGFVLPPDILGAELAAITEPPHTGPTVGGVYAYIAVWEWTDAAGQLHRSAPSAPFVYSHADSGAVELRVASLTTTRKRGVVLALYRNTAGGSLYYRVTPTKTPVNDPSLPFLTFTDDQDDVTLESNETLYATAEVDNDAPPASDIIVASRDRLFVAGGPGQDVVTWTKRAKVGRPPEFSLFFQRRVATPAGPITALASLEQRIVIFKPHSILYWTGGGPSDAGMNDDFSPTVLLTDQIGCTNQRSIVVDDREGIYFEAADGIWLLTRGMDLVRVGAAVAPLGNGACSAIYLPGGNRIRWGYGHDTRVYHPRLLAPIGEVPAAGQWTRYPNLPHVAATAWRGRYAWTRADGQVCVETPDTFTDAGRPYSAKIQTAWLRAGPPGGTATFGDMSIMGRRIGHHRLMVSVALDYRLPSATMTLDTTKALHSAAYGDDRWGGDVWGGSADDAYLFRGVTPVRTGQANAISLTLRDGRAESVDLGDSFALDALTIETQPEQGTAHTRRAKTMG